MSPRKQFDTSVELHLAFMWVCGECGADNFHRGVKPCLTEDELREARDEIGIEIWEEGSFMTRPNSVTCSACKCQFDTTEPDDYIEDEGFGYS